MPCNAVQDCDGVNDQLRWTSPSCCYCPLFILEKSLVVALQDTPFGVQGKMVYGCQRDALQYAS